MLVGTEIYGGTVETVSIHPEPCSRRSRSLSVVILGMAHCPCQASKHPASCSFGAMAIAAPADRIAAIHAIIVFQAAAWLTLQWREAEQNTEKSRALAVFQKRERPNSLLFPVGTHGTHADFHVFIAKPLKQLELTHGTHRTYKKQDTRKTNRLMPWSVVMRHYRDSSASAASAASFAKWP